MYDKLQIAYVKLCAILGEQTYSYANKTTRALKLFVLSQSVNQMEQMLRNNMGEGEVKLAGVWERWKANEQQRSAHNYMLYINLHRLLLVSALKQWKEADSVYRKI